LYRVEVFGMGRSRSFRAADVKNIRSIEYAFSPLMNQRTMFPPILGTGYGPVAFDYVLERLESPLRLMKPKPGFWLAR
jgi:hypothetical protein